LCFLDRRPLGLLTRLLSLVTYSRLFLTLGCRRSLIHPSLFPLPPVDRLPMLPRVVSTGSNIAFFPFLLFFIWSSRPPLPCSPCTVSFARFFFSQTLWFYPRREVQYGVLSSYALSDHFVFSLLSVPSLLPCFVQPCVVFSNAVVRASPSSSLFLHVTAIFFSPCRLFFCFFESRASNHVLQPSVHAFPPLPLVWSLYPECGEDSNNLFATNSPRAFFCFV